MKVILTTNIKKLGKIGDLVTVKDGFARNFLFPNKMALRENKKNLDYYEKIKTKCIKMKRQKNDAENILSKLSKLKIIFKKKLMKKINYMVQFLKRNIRFSN